jgi:hypothetical protein
VRIHRKIAWHRFGAAVACLCLLPLLGGLPALAALGTLVLLVAGVTVLEERFRHEHPTGSGGIDMGTGAADRGPVEGE